MPQRDLTNVSLDLLKTLAVFADTGRVEETAKRRGVTQAAVSLQLRRLETEVGQPLFQTLGRRKVLTDFARDLCQLIAPPLRDLDRKLAEVSRSSLSEEQRVWRVGCSPEVVARAIEALKFPGQRVFRILSEDALWNALEDDQIDFAIVPRRGALADVWGETPIFHDAVRFYAARMPEQAPKNRIEWITLLKNRLTTPVTAMTGAEHLIEEVSEKIGMDSSQIQWGDLADDWHAVRRLVEVRNSWSLVPAGLEFVSPEWDLPGDLMSSRPYSIVYRSERQALASRISSVRI